MMTSYVGGPSTKLGRAEPLSCGKLWPSPKGHLEGQKAMHTKFYVTVHKNFLCAARHKVVCIRNNKTKHKHGIDVRACDGLEKWLKNPIFGGFWTCRFSKIAMWFWGSRRLVNRPKNGQKSPFLGVQKGGTHWTPKTPKNAFFWCFLTFLWVPRKWRFLPQLKSIA